MLNLFLLGFSAGLPLALTSSTLQAWCTVSGVGILAIGTFSLVGQPYIYKFLWAPLMDRFTLPFLGRRRGWMFLTQLLLLFTIISFAFLNPAKDPLIVGIMALVIAFLSASQDISVDAYRAEILKPKDRGMGAAWFVNGYRFAMLVSGGLALIVADQWGWRVTYVLMGLFMSVGIFSTCFSKEPEVSYLRLPTTLKEALLGPFKQLLSQDKIFYFLLLIVLYKLGDAFIYSLSNTFLIRGLGFSLTTIGTLYKTVGLATTVFGLLLGGWLMQRLTLLQALFGFAVAQTVSNTGFIALSIIGKNTMMLGAVIATESFCNGMCTAALLALMMSLCDPRYTATQFAMLSALSAFGRVIIGPFAAIAVEQIGWTNFYIWVFFLSFPVLFLIWGMRPSLTPLTQEGSYGE